LFKTKQTIMYTEVTPLACKSEMLKLMSDTYQVDGYNINLMDWGWSFELNNSYSANGQCTRKNGDKILMLSEWLINNLNRPMSTWIDIMLHEIAHAIDIELRGHTDHSDLWVDVAHKIGCSGEISTDGVFKEGVHPIYITECSTCGNQELTNELSPHIKRGESSCGKCYPSGFNHRFIMTWRPNPEHIHDTAIKSSLYTFGRTK